MDRTFSNTISYVMSRYPGKAGAVRMLSYKGKKAVWSVDTDKGERIVKLVPFDDRDIEFMVHAIDYMRKRGLRTPAVIRTSDGKGWVTLNGLRFVVFEAVSGRQPEYRRNDDLRLIMRGMARFHKASRGIVSPTRYYPSLLLYEWEARRRASIERMEAWKAEASAKKKPSSFDRLYLAHADEFMKQARESIERLKRAGFDRWTEETKLNKTLCHQDFAAGNLVIDGNGRLYVYDMDSLTVDVPLRDIRKILNKVMKKESSWDIGKMLTMLKAYQEVNPLAEKQYQALAAELLFPHLAYGQASKYYKKRDAERTEEQSAARFRELIATERSKLKTLRQFLDRIGEVTGHRKGRG